MRTLERRLHLLLDEARYRKVAREAQRRGLSVGAVVREAIDQMPAGDLRRSSVTQILAAEPMPVPADPAELRHEIEAAREHSA